MADKRSIVIEVTSDIPQTTKDLIGLNAEGKKTVTTIDSLEDAVEGLEKALKGSEVGSAQYEELRTQLRGAKTELESLEGGFEAIQIHDRVDSVVKFGEAAVGAFGLAAAGMQAFGADAEQIEKVEKTLLATITAMQSLSAISEAFSSENLKKFSALKESIGQYAKSFKTAGTAATTMGKTTKIALLTTGIGVFIVALGLVVTYWDDITAAINKNAKAAKKAKDETLKYNTDLVNSTDDYNLALQRLNITQENTYGKGALEIAQSKKGFAHFINTQIDELDGLTPKLRKEVERLAKSMDVYDKMADNTDDEKELKNSQKNHILRLESQFSATERIIAAKGAAIRAKWIEFNDGIQDESLTATEALDLFSELNSTIASQEQKDIAGQMLQQYISGKESVLDEVTDKAKKVVNAEKIGYENQLIALATANKLSYDATVRAGASEIDLSKANGEALLANKRAIGIQIAALTESGTNKEYLQELLDAEIQVDNEIANNKYVTNLLILEDEATTAEKKKEIATEVAAHEEALRIEKLVARAAASEEEVAVYEATAEELKDLRDAQRALTKEENALDTEEAVLLGLESLNVLGDVFALASSVRISAIQDELEIINSSYTEGSKKIRELNKSLSKATAAEKVAILAQIAEEEAAQERLAAKKIALEKTIAEEQYKAAKIQYALDLTNSVVKGSLAVLAAAATLNPFIIALTAATVATGIATVALNPPKPPQAAEGMLIGDSHADGGIPIRTPGGMIEAEGGEIIINKKSSALFRHQLSAINSYGGNGKKFESGGEIDVTAQSNITNAVSDLSNAEIVAAIQNIQIYTSIQEVREADANFTSIEETATL